MTRPWSRGRSLIRRALVAALPNDDWTAEFIAELDAALAHRAERMGGFGLTFWYLRQVISPQTLQFTRAMRERERKRNRSGYSMNHNRLRAFISGVGMDTRQAWRGVARDPWAALLIVVTLGLGIGSVTAMYGLGSRLFLTGPMHVAEPDRVVRVILTFEDAGGTRTSPWMPYRTARALQDNASQFSSIGLYRLPEELVQFGDRVQPTAVAAVDGNYFDVFRVVPEAGRFFSGSPAPDPGVAVLSHAAAVRQYGSPEAALGETIRVGARSQSVIGVAPLGFAGPGLDRVDVWIPLNQALAGNRNWMVAARLSAGATWEAAMQEAQAIHEVTDPGRFFQWARDGAIEVAGIGTDLSGEQSAEISIAGLLMGVVVLVLLIAWTNVLNLLLARVTRRSGEVTVRLALGIGRWRLVRLLLAESLMLSLVGGLLSLPVAYAEGLLVRRVLLPDVAWAGSALDLRLMIVTFVVVLVSGAILGVLPARRASKTDLAQGFSSARQGVRPGATRLQSALATAQITLSAALLLCAGLFVKSFWTIRVTDLGVDAEQVRVVTLRSLDEWSGSRDEQRERAARIEDLYGQALVRVRGEASGTTAAVSVGLPFFTNFGKSIHVDGRDSIPELPGGGPYITMVSDGYFETVGTAIQSGVGISQAHTEGGQLVTVIGETTARLLWPGGNALGQCIRVGAPQDPCFTVIGVAKDVHRQGYREDGSLQLYVPLGSTSGFSGSTLLIRASRGSGAYESQLSAELSSMDPLIDYVDVRRLDSFLEAEIRPWRLGAVMLSMVGGLAIAMSIAGVFGVLSYVVAQRRREIGVRMALGATRNSIRGLVVRLGLGSGVVGVVLGFAAVIAASRWLGPLLFETSVVEPLVMLAVASGLVTVALLACLIPAFQAARVDPIATLRAEG